VFRGGYGCLEVIIESLEVIIESLEVIVESLEVIVEWLDERFRRIVCGE